MTPAEKPGERGQRVCGCGVNCQDLRDGCRYRISDEELEQHARLVERDFAGKTGDANGFYVLDLRDARAEIARLTAENEALHSAKQISDAAATYWEDETRKARAALATAKRDGWIAGRDAAAAIAELGLFADGGCYISRGIAARIRTLEPPRVPRSGRRRTGAGKDGRRAR